MSGDSGKNTWRKQSGFIFSLLGSAVGFGNLLSFSAVCYRNGGGAFLIPYCIALFMLGIPMLLLEGLIGHTWKMPVVTSFSKVMGFWGRAFGWLSVLACITIGAFYIVLTGYSCSYTYFAACEMIPQDTAGFFKEAFLHITSSIFDWGAFSWAIFAATCIVSVFTWLVLVRKVQDGIEKICTFFMPFLAGLIVLFAVTAFFLPGALDGIIHYLAPNFSKLSDPLLWRDVFGQLLFSLSLGLGIIVGYARHSNTTIDIGKSMIYVALGDFIISFIAGFAVFGCIGHMSFVSHIPFDEIVSNASTFEIGFIIFPKILAQFGPTLALVFGVLFFASLALKGSAGVFSIVESIAGNIETEFAITRKKAVTYATSIITVLAGLFCFGNSSYLIDAIAPMVLGTNMLIGSIALIYVFLWKTTVLQRNEVWEKSIFRSMFYYSLKYFVPLILIGILLGNIVREVASPDISVEIGWLWFALACVLSCIISACARSERKRMNNDSLIQIAIR